jgi:Tol biopolymer transport system component
MKGRLTVGLVVLMLIVASCASGDGLVNLTPDSRVADGPPSWSPDGSKILFVSSISSPPEGIPTITDYGIYVMDADGRNRTQVLALPSDVSARSPSWSPDGKRIVYASGGGAILTMASNGRDLSPGIGATGMFGISDWPSYSPDGTKILFSSQREGKWQIYVVDVDGSNEIRLSPEEVEREYMPAWSPNGTRIAFQSSRDGNPEIYVMNADGSNPTRLTRNKAGDGYPIWSPNGTKIAFISNRDGQPDIYIMNADGSDVTRLTDNSIYKMSLSWSPDGTKIAFCGYPPDESEANIYVVNVTS